jgi:hypothetical protein
VWFFELTAFSTIFLVGYIAAPPYIGSVEGDIDDCAKPVAGTTVGIETDIKIFEKQNFIVCSRIVFFTLMEKHSLRFPLGNHQNNRFFKAIADEPPGEGPAMRDKYSYKSNDRSDTGVAQHISVTPSGGGSSGSIL